MQNSPFMKILYKCDNTENHNQSSNHRKNIQSQLNSVCTHIRMVVQNKIRKCFIWHFCDKILEACPSEN